MANLPWGDAQLFLEIVRSGSIRGAARVLRVDASTVSRRLAALEQGVGVRLVDRTTHRLALTAAGRQLAESGERVQGEFDALARKIALHDRRVGGVVQLSVPGSLAPLAVQAIATLSSKHPEIEINLLTHDALSEVDGLGVHVAIRIADAPPPHLIGQRVGVLPAAIYATSAYIATYGRDVGSAESRWVDWDRRLAQKPAFQWLDQQYGPRRIAARGLSTLDVLQLVRQGLGLGALPCVLGDADRALRRLADVPTEHATAIWVLAHPELRTLPRVRLLVSALRAVLPAATVRKVDKRADRVGTAR
ncbi:MAG: hypothetical protein RLZZ450_131 [Pseudomonadota bacterium]|jgi:DNA-binding transcriptional LysR family regulator